MNVVPLPQRTADVGAVRFRAGSIAALERLSHRGYPEEVCGLLLGRSGTEGFCVHRVTAASNRVHERRRDRYELEPRDFLAADALARAAGWDVIGVWHTHPDHPARPSQTDLDAAWPGFLYVILSVRREGVIDVRGWRLDGRKFAELTIEEVSP